MEFKFKVPDEVAELIKEYPKINWSNAFSRMLFKELSKTKLSEETARKLSDEFGKQIFKQIKEKLPKSKGHKKLSLDKLRKAIGSDRISDEDPTELIRKMRDKKYD